MQLFILCGGLGTRLRPLTEETPKPMLLFQNKPFLEYLLIYYRHQGIGHFIFSVGYLQKQIVNYFQDGKKWGVSIMYSKENIPLGTGGALKMARSLLEPEFLVVNGDTFVEISLKNLINFHKKHHPLCSMAVMKTARQQNSGYVTFDTSFQINQFESKSVPKDKEGYINTGVYCMNKKILHSIPDGQSSLEHDIFPKIIKQIGTHIIPPGYFVDIGTFDTYNQFAQELNKVKTLIHDPFTVSSQN